MAALLAGLLIVGVRQVRGTTLRAPCIWALVSTLSLAFVALVEARYVRDGTGIGLSALRFAAVASTFCPLMAVLGAKRPQNRGWQWVVLTLWLVVAWPAVQAVLLPAGARIELFIAWKLFLVGLVAVGMLNYLPTRNGGAAILVALGQLVLLDDYLWRWLPVAAEWVWAAGLACFLLAAILAAFGHCARKGRLATAGRGIGEFDRRWLEFRDAYGALWALQIVARVNQTAELRDWPLRLAWSGFVSARAEESSELTSEQSQELELALSTLLRRFNRPD